MQYLLIDHPTDIQNLLIRVAGADHTYLKFLAPNDLDLTGSHQAGIYMARDSWPMFFDTPGKSGENRDFDFTVIWDDGFRSRSRFVWYGKKKSEYRITKFREFYRGREEFLGALFILIRKEEEFRAWVLNEEDEILAVLNFFGISPTETNRLLRFDLDSRLREDFEILLKESRGTFPETDRIARKAQQIHEKLFGSPENDPDEAISHLIDIEYALFRSLEKEIYSHIISRPFRSVDELLSFSLEINNRRKSRAGKSLELHLRYIFQIFRVPFAHGAVTREEKRPDFIFPGKEEYDNPNFPEERLFFLGAKTTCKDRWRQILIEANRIRTKYLFTLQQGISSSQLREMKSEGVIPVIPARLHASCKEKDREGLMTLAEFIRMVLNANGEVESLF